MNLDIPPKPGHVFFDILSGPVGDCLVIGDQSSGHRLAGPKPWGGGRISRRFSVSVEELEAQIACYRRHMKQETENE